VAVPAVALTAGLPGPLAAGPLPPALLGSTVATALSFARGTAAASSAVALALAVLRGFRLARVKWCLGLLAGGALLVLLGTALVLGASDPAAPAADAPGPAGPLAGPPPHGPKPAPGPVGRRAADDPLEDPLPEGALARLGTTRFRTGGTVRWLTLSRDGKRLVSVGGNGLFVWDTATGKRLLHDLRFPVLSPEISRDGERLLVVEGVRAGREWIAPNNTELRVYRLTSGELLQAVRRPEALVGFALAPDDRTVALACLVQARPRANNTPRYKCHLELRDLSSNRLLRRFGEQWADGATGWIGLLAWLRFSPDGKTLFAVNALEDRNGGKVLARRFDCATGALQGEMAIDGTHYLDPFVWDGKALVATGNKIWDLAKGRPHWQSKKDLGGIYAFMPDGETVLAVPGKGATLGGKLGAPLVLWDLEADREIRRFPNRGDFPFVLAPDGKSCFGSAGLYGLCHWDTATGKEVPGVEAPTEPARCVAFSPDRKHLATVDLTAVHVWDRQTGKRVHHCPAQLRAGLLRFTPDGKTVVFTDSSRVAALDLATGKKTERTLPGLELPPGTMNYCELSPDGKVLAASSLSWGRPQAIKLWDWASGKRIGTLGGDKGVLRMGPLAFSPDSKRLAARVHPQNRLQIWELASRKRVADWETPPELVMHLFLGDAPAFLGAGEFLAGSFRDGSVRVWGAATGKEKVRFRCTPHKEHLNLSPSFSPDGKLVATADRNDNLVRFWDLATGKQVGQFRSSVGGVEGVAFSPDGSVLAVCGRDTTTLLLDVRKVLGKR
jgi:WD40 repeat protein